MEIGDFVKVQLPGERPWAEVTGVMGSTIQARIDNDLIGNPEMHNYQIDQEIRLIQTQQGLWRPVEE